MAFHQLSLADESSIDLINELYDYSLVYGYPFYCLTSSSEEDIQQWKENTGAEYPFCLMDNITLKTIVRSNPGLVLLKNGTVVRKWSVHNLPNEYQLEGPLDILSIGRIDYQSFVYKTLMVMAWFIFPLLFICMVDMIWERHRNRRQNIVEESE